MTSWVRWYHSIVSAKKFGQSQISSTSPRCMVQTRAQEMANERMESLETSLKDVVSQLKELNATLSKGKAEAYISTEHCEGESSQSLHLFGTHQQSHPWPPKLDMYKFDGSHPAAWITQMEQYFNLNYILDNATQLSVGIMYLDNERLKWWKWHHQHCYGRPLTWETFKKSLMDRFDHEYDFLGRVTKLQ